MTRSRRFQIEHPVVRLQRATAQTNRHLPISTAPIFPFEVAGKLFTVAMVWTVPTQADEAKTWSAAKRERMKVVSRQRRVIFNDDMYELDRTWANTEEGLLKGRMIPLVGTQVDTVSVSIIEADAPVYDSKVQPIYGLDAHGEDPAYWPNIGPNIKTLAKQGKCPIQIHTDFAHKHSMEMWAHLRMNDVHDSFLAGWLSLWKKKHRDLLVDTQGMLPDKRLYVTAKNMTHEECRRRKLEIVEEVAGRYDIDGFELDYIRHCVLFSRTMRGEPVTRQEVQIMTSLMRQMRQLTDEAAARRGRPIVIAARVPDTLIQSMNIGLDVRTWLEEDLVDILIIGGGYAVFSLDPTEFVEIARPYGVAVYPCINVPRYPLAARRALAARWYRAGADGIYTWNQGSPFEYKTGEDLIENRRREYADLYEIGDPKMLVGKDKLYPVQNRVNKTYHFIAGNAPLPLTLEAGASHKIPLPIGDDVEATAGSASAPRLTLELHLKGPVREYNMSTSLNGQRLTDGERRDLDPNKTHVMRYQLSAPPLKIGENVVEVSISRVQVYPPVSKQAVTLYAMQLFVDYP